MESSTDFSDFLALTVIPKNTTKLGAIISDEGERIRYWISGKHAG